MPQENVHEQREKRRFTLVVLPGNDAHRTRTFSISVWGISASVVAAVFVIAAVVFAVIVFTPARSLFPISNHELEHRYGKQVVEIQEQVNLLLREMTVLREYNMRLRKALGEQITDLESSAVAAKGMKALPETSLSVSQNKQHDVEGTSSSAARNVQLPSMQSTATTYNGNKTGHISSTEFPLTVPTQGYLSRGFDVQQYHYGVDFAGKVSSPVVAAADGSVVFSDWTYDDGYMMMIAHEGSYVTIYKHNEALMKTTGSFVKRGEIIALLGNTGKSSSGPHVHFEVWKDGVAQDPMQYLLTVQ